MKKFLVDGWVNPDCYDSRKVFPVILDHLEVYGVELITPDKQRFCTPKTDPLELTYLLAEQGVVLTYSSVELQERKEASLPGSKVVVALHGLEANVRVTEQSLGNIRRHFSPYAQDIAERRIFHDDIMVLVDRLADLQTSS